MGNNLSIYRAKSHKVKNDFRDSFSLDRDKIMYSTEFRRLDGKTQVFVCGFDDNMRNRLTHTLEVSQIATTICNGLGLNTMLAEAIAFGHDVGHTPFGHVGERFLHQLTNNCIPEIKQRCPVDDNDRGFKHNLQGVKVVNELETLSTNGIGLELTSETLWGIAHHSNLEYRNKCRCFYDENKCSTSVECSKNGELSLSHYKNLLENAYNSQDWSFEAIIVREADEIAQRHHDIEDGIRAGLITKNDFIKEFCECFKCISFDKRSDKCLSYIKNNPQNDHNESIFFNNIASLIIATYSNQLAFGLGELAKELDCKSPKAFKEEKGKYLIDDKLNNIYEKTFSEADINFKKWASNIILNSSMAQQMDGKASYILQKLCEAYVTNPCWLPDKTLYSFAIRINAEKYKDQTANEIRRDITSLMLDSSYSTKLIRTITDYIAGMTDNYAIAQYKQLYGSDNYWRY